jgi:3-oxoadipate enol-lactonase
MTRDTEPGRPGTTTAADGTLIAYTDHGDHDARVLVVMHSLGSSGSMWAPQIAALSERFRLLVVDTRGHGRSQAPPGPYDLSLLGNDVLAVADHAGADRFHALGLSLGGQMAMWLALHATDRVRSIVAANTAAKLGTDDSWGARIAAVSAGGTASVRDAVLDRWFADGFPDRHPDWFAEAQRVFSATDPVGYMGCCAALRDTDLRDSVAAISTPTLVIGGDVDVATPPEQATWLHEQIGSSELTIFERAGHLSNLDRAEAFTERVLQFLAA